MYKFLDRHNIPRPNWVDGVVVAGLGYLIFAIVKRVKK